MTNPNCNSIFIDVKIYISNPKWHESKFKSSWHLHDDEAVVVVVLVGNSVADVTLEMKKKVIYDQKSAGDKIRVKIDYKY